MASFANSSGSFLGVGGDPVQVIYATPAQTVQLRRGSGFYFTFAGSLATLNILMPAAERGQEVTLGFKGIVTTLSIKDRFGAAIAGTPTAATANSAYTFIYVNKAIGWVPWV